MPRERILELLLGGAAAIVGFIAFLIFQTLSERRRKERERRLGLDDQSGILIRGGKPAADGDWSDRMDASFDQMVSQTGLGVTAEEIVATMCLLGVLIGGGLYLWRDQLGLGLLGFALGLLIPLTVVYLLRGRHQALVQEQLPDALYLIARSLRAGMSLEQAIELLAEEGPKPVATEFEKCAASIRLGLSPATAVQMMAERLDLIDVNAFSSTVAFHQTVGGNLPLLLDRLAAGARDRNQFRGQFWAATAQGRITAVALAAAAPLLVLSYLIFQPDHVQTFLNSTRGWMVLGVAALMEVIGMIWVYQVLKVDY
jgi:tight adherence protein B